jgi:predicted RNase H-like HicB family nuclease
MSTAIYEMHGEWWAAHTEVLPGVNPQGGTLDEARKYVAEAFQVVAEKNRELARREEPADCVREPLALPV